MEGMVQGKDAPIFEEWHCGHRKDEGKGAGARLVLDYLSCIMGEYEDRQHGARSETRDD